ncbi:Adenylate kinase/UMP-CMP kinase [Parasponia andersonii]|uniref:adenylate kinase n=1 Tax=Parasponia andersonii TaxID=3476 RepID=A0A2P5DVP5_PARAD|nr:Adenylate kinase/UMP-CMP kinase [Parasponia andersonii]
MIQDEHGLCQLDKVELIRAAFLASTTPFGDLNQEAMDKKELVQEDLVVGVIGEAIQDFILDGELTTVDEAQKLEDMLAKQGVKIDKVLNFAIDDAILEEMNTNRWIHRSSGRVYHSKFATPKVPGINDVTGEPLVQNQTDNAAILESSLKFYRKLTEPKPPEEVRAEILKVLSS